MLKLRVKEVAQSQGINIQQLAERAKLSYDTVLKYWHNQVRRVDLSTLEALAIALNVSSLELLEEVA